MKLLVLSDSHGTLQNMEQAILSERPDYVVHLGDHITDADDLSLRFPMLPVAKVTGNCDFYTHPGQDEIVSVWGGVRMLLTHGHRYGVKQGLLRLSLAAREKHAQVVLFGHTHQPLCLYDNDIWLLNPGSCAGSRPTYALVEIDGEEIHCSLKP